MFTAGRPRETFCAELEKVLRGAGDVLDIGTDQRYSKELRALESYFDGSRYVAAGYNPQKRFGEYDCDLHLDVCAIDLAENSYDCVLCLEVLEHVTDPFAAAKELVRILRPGGRLFLTVPFITGYHGHPASSSSAHDDFPDFWRFTHQGLERMFNSLEELEVRPLDGPIEARLRLTPLVRFLERDGVVRALVDRFDRPLPGKITTRHLVTGRKSGRP